jgi:hypothetical protein
MFHYVKDVLQMFELANIGEMYNFVYEEIR